MNTTVRLTYPLAGFTTCEYLSCTPDEVLSSLTGDRLEIGDMTPGESYSVAYATGSTVEIMSGVLLDEPFYSRNNRWLIEFQTSGRRTGASVSVPTSAVIRRVELV